jgi:hypothetical protein
VHGCCGSRLQRRESRHLPEARGEEDLEPGAEEHDRRDDDFPEEEIPAGDGVEEADDVHD